MPNPRAQRPLSLQAVTEDIRSLAQPAEALLDMLAGAAKGSVSATAGIGGDIQSLGQGIASAYRAPSGQRLNAFFEGMDQPTFLPTTEQVSAKLPDVVPPTAPLSRQHSAGYGQAMGEFIPTPGSGRVYKGALNAVKSIPAAVEHGAQEFAKASAIGVPHVIKPKGGNWMTGSVEKDLKPLRQPVPAEVAQNIDPRFGINPQEQQTRRMHASAINNWIDRNLTNYVKKEMATPEDTVRKLAEQGITHYPVAEDPGYWARHGATAREERGGEAMAQSPLAKQWENRTDAMIDRNLAQEHQDMMHLAPGMYSDKDAWIKNLDPSTILYSAHGRHFSPLDLGFDHIVDVLKEDLATGRIRPEQLSKVSMEQAVRRTYEYDQELAKKMADARAAAREGLPVYKEYPEGFRWVELNKPGAFANESEAMGHSVRGYEPPKGHADWIAGSGDSGSLGYGHGGWEAIKSGKAKVYSLVDPKGNPHVTVEAKKNPYAPKHDEIVSEMKKRNNLEQLSDNEYNVAYHQALDHLVENSPPIITQIKGKQNAAPKEEYLPFVQDFVRSSGMPVERDLQNTGLHKFGSEYLTPQEAETKFKPMVSDALKYLETHPSLERHRAARQARNDFVGDLRSPEYRQLEKQAGESIAPDVPYTYAELKALLSSPEDWTERGDTIYTPISTALQQIERAKQHLGPLPSTEGMKRGGRVHISDNPDTMMMELKGKKMSEGGAAFGVFPQMKPRRSKQDREASANVPVDLARGFVAGALGAPSDIANLPSDIYQMVTGNEGYKVPYGSEHWKETLPLQPTSAVGKAAQELGGFVGGAYSGQGAPIRAVANIPGALSHGAKEFAKASAQAAPHIYRPHTPGKPDPTVGSRYVTTHVGNLAPKTIFDIEKEQGSSVMSNPWDLTSRGEKVLEVSDVPLVNPIVTEGGHDFARDIGHINTNIGGASGLAIAKRMQDRVNDAYFANMLENGTGRVFTMPSTMDVTGSNYSTMPVDIVMDLLSQAGLKSKDLNRITDDIKTFMFEGEKGKFKNAAPVGTPEFLRQLREGGKGFSAGDLRKGVMNRLSKAEYQKMIGFNIEDVYGAIHDPSLKGYPKGYVGNTMIETVPFADLTQAKHGSYDTANAGKYAGSLPSMPLELMMPDLYQYFEAMYLANPKYQKLTPNQLRTTIVNTIEKKGSVISQPINQRVVDNVMRYKEGLAQGHFNPKDYDSVMEFMKRTGGYKKGGSVKMAEGGLSTGAQRQLEDMFVEPTLLEKAGRLIEDTTRRGLDVMFPMRKIVRTGAEPMMEDWHYKTVMTDPDTSIENQDITSNDARRALFHIKNAALKKIGMPPVKGLTRTKDDNVIQNSFPAKAAGGEVHGLSSQDLLFLQSQPDIGKMPAPAQREYITNMGGKELRQRMLPKKAAGGEITADDLILEERKL